MSARFQAHQAARELRLDSTNAIGSASHRVMGDPTAFYVWVSVTPKGSGSEYRQSGWVRGNADLHHKLRRQLMGAVKASFIAACMQVIKEHPHGSR